MKTLNSKTGLILVVAVIILSIALLASIFIMTGNLLTSSPGGSSITSPQNGSSHPGGSVQSNVSSPIVSVSNDSAISLASSIPTSFNNLSDTPLFNITGVTGTAYLRCSVGDIYSNGSWYSNSASTTYTVGGTVAVQTPQSYASKVDENVQISPILQLVDFIPSFKDTLSIDFPSSATISLQYSSSDQAFYSSNPISSQYNVSYDVFSYNSTILEGATVSSDSSYLQVPSDISAPLKQLADSITANATTPYDKAIALQTYLQSNYQYSFNYTAPPNGTDPVLWFLFQDKEGVCIQFNSAFVLLARSVGLPARLVVGYLISPTDQQQTVAEDQAHAYSEILFNGLGWVTFDATGGSDTGIPDSDLSQSASTGGNSSGLSIELPTGPVSTSDNPVFMIFGVTGTNFTRAAVGDEYNNGSWSSSSSGAVGYNGQQLPQPNVDIPSTLSSNDYSGPGLDVTILPEYWSVTIFPVLPMQGSIETMNFAVQVGSTSTALSYNADDQIFATAAPVTDEYNVSYDTFSLSPSELNSVTVPSDSEYLGVPASMAQNLSALATNITAGAVTPYEKAVALESYLQSNYVYSLNITTPPNGTDPVMWFLFQSKQGNCVDFNSAFALLARSIGIPTRVVSGYLISPTAAVQTVLSADAYTYAEVLFNSVGWVTFDASPSGVTQVVYNLTNQPGLTPTYTNITSVSGPIGIAGQSFSVNGTVTDSSGNPVSGLNVIISLTGGNASGMIVGEGTVENGVFQVTCSIPTTLAVGSYQVTAQTLGNGVYNDSVSDPQITIGSGTTIAFWAPQEAIIGSSFNIIGQITATESGQGLAGVPLVVTCDNETTDLVTDPNGEFSLGMNLTSFGVNNITVSFTGQLLTSSINGSDSDGTGSSNDTEYYLSSLATRQVMVPQFSIVPMSQNLVRGESNLLMCRLMAGSIPVNGESVNFTLNSIEYSGITNNEGYADYLVPVPSDSPLGNTTLTYSFEPYNVTSNQSVTIMARTFLEISLETGNPLRIDVKLVDDLGEPIANQILTASLNSTGRLFVASSNAAGNAIFKTDIPDLEAINGKAYLVSFNGSDLYLPASSSGTVRTSSDIAPAILALIGAVGLPSLLFALRKRSLPSVAMKGTEGTSLAIPAGAAVNNDLNQSQYPWKFEISFSGVSPPLPNTFGVGEAVEVTIRSIGADAITNGTILAVDGKVDQKLDMRSGSKSLKLSLSKGSHVLSILVGDKKVAEAPVSIVDYKEEVVRLYNEYFTAVKAQDSRLNDRVTPGEFESIHGAGLPIEGQSALREITYIFELSNYSLHGIYRSDYLKMYLHLAELKSRKNT